MLPTDLRQAYSLARDALRTQRDVLGDRPGHRLFWVSGVRPGQRQITGHGILPCHPAWDAAVIVGGHSQCGLRLEHDPSVALRHLLLRSIETPVGGAAMRVLDLHTDLGFMLSDGSMQTSIFAEGTVAIAIGEHALVAFPARAPIDGIRDDRFPTEFPVAEMSMSADLSAQLAALSNAVSPYRVNARLFGSSRITLMPRLVMLGEVRDPPPRAIGMGERWSVTLERDGRSAMETVSEADLAGGVLIGRSEKCHSEELRRITDNNTSRVHVLLLREAEHVCAYDLASTHAMFHDGAPAHRVVLGPAATLTLGGGKAAVRLLWRRAA